MVGEPEVFNSLEVREMTVGINKIGIGSAMISFNLGDNRKSIAFHIDEISSINYLVLLISILLQIILMLLICLQREDEVISKYLLVWLIFL